MTIPKVLRDKIINVLKLFDEDYRILPKWANRDSNHRQKYAISTEATCIPRN